MKLNRLPKTACVLVLLASTAMPMLANAESADMSVTGTISPGSCTPTLTGTIDFGAINPASLSEDEYTVLDEQVVDFGITCDARVRVGVKAINLQPGTLAGSSESGEQNVGTSPVSLFGWPNVSVVGLGLEGTSKIGGYALRLTGLHVGGGGGGRWNIRSENKGGSWSTNATGSLYDLAATRYISWADTSTSLTVDPVENLTGKLVVNAYLNKASELDSTKPIVLNGRTTLELVYL